MNSGARCFLRRCERKRRSTQSCKCPQSSLHQPCVVQYVHSCSLLFSIENETFGQKYSVMMILSHIINNIACCNFFLTKTNRSQEKFAAFLTFPPRDYSTLLEPIIQVIYRINLHYLVMILIAIGNSQQACGQTTP